MDRRMESCDSWNMYMKLFEFSRAVCEMVFKDCSFVSYGSHFVSLSSKIWVKLF